MALHRRRLDMLDFHAAARPHADYLDGINGVKVRIERADRYHALFTIDGEHPIRRGDLIGLIDFTPGGREKFERGSAFSKYNVMMDSIVRGVSGLSKLIGAIERGKLPEVVFTGSTNVNMALAAQRFGFKLVDQTPMKDNGEFRHNKLRVIGRIKDIKPLVEAFRNSPRFGRMERKVKEAQEVKELTRA